MSDPAYAEKMARALAALGSERVLVVHGSDGLDELTLSGPTHTWWVESGEVHRNQVSPEDVGLRRAPFSDVQGGGVEANTRVFFDVLEGKQGPHADLVALNAGAALWVAQQTSSIRDGVQLAKKLLKNGKALARFESYREAARATAV